MPHSAPSRQPEFAFSVVSAAYNVEAWIGSFLQSIKAQSLDFKKYIQVIIVDDGSTDGTRAIAEGWADEHPENIVYIHQENKGVASARNTGLNFAQGAWVTFCDSDDFVCDTYFETVKTFLDSGFDGMLVVCNPIYFFEKTNSFSDTHWLRFKFQNGNTVVDLDQHPEYVQFFVHSAFVQRKALLSSGLCFDERVRPSFEDGHLLNKFLLLSGTRKVAMLKDALYFYRKHDTGKSLIASGWDTAEKYRDQIFYGYLDLVKLSEKKLGLVPPFIQQVVICDMYWYMKKFLNHSVPIEFSRKDFLDFLDIVHLLFVHIDAEQLLFSRLPLLSPLYRLAMLNIFKKMSLAFPVIVQEMSLNRKEALVIGCTGGKSFFSFRSGEAVITPLWERVVRHRFRGMLLCAEHHFRLPLEGCLPLSCSVDGQAVAFLYKGEIFNALSAAVLLQEK